MRAHAACALAIAASPPSRARQELRAKLAAERDLPVRISLVLAVTQLAQPGTGCWRHVRRDLLHGLATWHNQAAGTAAALTGLLVRPGEHQHAIAVPVPDELPARAAAELVGVLARARWRITGERTAQTAHTWL